MEEMTERECEENNDTSSSALKTGTATGDFGDDTMAWLSMDDELMNLLDNTTHDAESEAAVTPVKFIDDPYSSPLIFQSSSSYVTINGNEESCGSSFSDSETSLMVSVDMGGLGRGGCEVGKWISKEEEEESGGLWKGGEMKVSDCKGSDFYDYSVLERFLMEESVF